jgi:phytanoyl-CoA hydroxylase
VRPPGSCDAAKGRADKFHFSVDRFGFGDEVVVEVAVGSVVFFNGYLPHQSPRKCSGHSRRALVNHYCNAWSLLPWGTSPFEKLPAFEISTRDERKIVPIDEDRYAWKG